MLEEYLTDKIEDFNEDELKLKTDEDMEVVESSYTYKKTEASLDKKAQRHYLLALVVAMTVHAIDEKLLKTKLARKMARDFMMNDTVKRIREKLYRKGDPTRGIPRGLLRGNPGETGIVKSIRRHRPLKAQMMSTGINTRQAGMGGGGMISDGLKKLLSMSLYVEEFSPMKIGRTFSATHVLHSLKMRHDMPEYHIPSKDIQNMGSYYGDMIEKHGNSRILNTFDTTFGLFYHEGAIYGAKKDAAGKIIRNESDLLSKGVMPVFTETDLSGTGVDKSINQIFRKYLIEEGIRPTVLDSYNKSQNSKKVSFMIAGDDFRLSRKFATSYISKMFESGSRALDTPFAPLAEFVEGRIRDLPNSASKSLHKSIYNALSPRFGSGTLSTQGNMLLYDRALGEQVKALSKNVIIKPLLLAAAGMTINNFIGETFGEKYRAEQIGGDIIANAHLFYAKIFSDGKLAEIRDKQEEIMPGSTGFMPIAGIVGSFAMTGASASYIKGIHEKVRFGIPAAEAASGKAPLNITLVEDSLRRTLGQNSADLASSLFTRAKKAPLIGEWLSKEHHRGTRWAVAGAAIGAALSIPLLLGALAGTSSEELQRQYSGEDNVDVRANAGWLMGGEEHEGGKIKYFDKSWYAKLKSGAKTKELYGDAETRNKLNPISHPFSYLSDPYQFEKMHEKDSPFPIWGMDVTYGGFIGEAFEATLGRIIKPTIVNQNLKPYMSDNNKDGEYKLKVKVKKDEAELIKEGKMLSPIAPDSDPTKSALKKGVIGTLDFSGLKGFIAQTAISNSGYSDPLLTASELEVSGSATTMARNIKESNLGDLHGLGEAQRRIVNTGADSLAGRKENPIRNNMPYWMPGDSSGFYIDFQHGSPYTKIDNAETRLPGMKGYEEFNPNMKGVSPDLYPIINKYEILSDVALGSKEYYSAKREIENKGKRGELSDYERKKLEKIEIQTEERQQHKRFRDDLSVSDVENKYGVVAGIARGYWNMLSGAAQGPQETLSPLRLGSKFIHDRTDIEDYKKNVLYGNDMALWSEPVNHFGKAAVQQLLDKADSEIIVPDSVEKKRAINQYFDRLEFYKQRQIYKEARDTGNTDKQKEAKAKYEGTKIGALYTGLNSTLDMFAMNRSMTPQERDYMESFASKEDPEKQKEVLQAVSHDEAKIYASVWNNKKRYEALETEEEKAAFQVDNTEEYEKKMEQAEQESMAFMKETIGIPDVDFAGWDERIDMKDVKLRFLQVAGENVREYGYWSDDELEMLRKVAVLQDSNFLKKTKEVDKLSEKYTEESRIEFDTRKSMMINNVKAKNVEVKQGNGSIEFVEKNKGPGGPETAS
jgi:hypothetical protein